MGDEGEKTCPLCAEEMDLTDKQLKPCKCGYEICVWCWHHIMDMAEKDDNEGRCPACRTPYDKEKIVGMAANCERLVTEFNSERKMKLQKAKPKTSEGRKHLSSVRVIQRNLVYIIGLPLNLADEDLLQCKEYFGQYGKVLKGSISRTSSGAIQHSSNNTCSVYITYSKEEEAARCIQSVHGFILYGRTLKACFGTTKYCHAWLRNMPCSNPDCLYLHEIGAQEDSFTKDEIISAYTRSRVQQITGATINLQRRSGNMLPPPADDYCNNSTASTGKPIVKSAPNLNPASQVRGSPPGSSERSIALPATASWGSQVLNCRSSASSSTCSNGSTKQKLDLLNDFLVLPSAITSTTVTSALHGDVGKNFITEESYALHLNDKLGTLESTKQYITRDCWTTVSDVHTDVILDAAPATLTSSNHLPCLPAPEDKDRGITLLPNITSFADLASQSSGSGPDKDMNVTANGDVQSLCSGLLSMSIDGQLGDGHSDTARSNNSVFNHLSIKLPGNQGLQQYNAKQYGEPTTSTESRKAALVSNGICISEEHSDQKSGSHPQILQDVCGEVEKDILDFDVQSLNDVVVSHPSCLSHSLKLSNHLSCPWEHNKDCTASNYDSDPRVVHRSVDESCLAFKSGERVASNGYIRNKVSNSAGLNGVFKHPSLILNAKEGNHLGSIDGNIVNAANVDKSPDSDVGESSIISNILSMDFDAWDDTLNLPNNFTELLNESDKQQSSFELSSSWKVQNSNQSRFSFAREESDKQQSSFELSSSWKVQNSNQSRFSFAREEDFTSQVTDLESSFSNSGHMPKKSSILQNPSEYRDKLRNGLPSNSFEESDTSRFIPSIISSSKLSVPRAQISAPPGFSVPNRAPPPGFSPHERLDQAFNTTSGNHLFEASYLTRNQYQASATGNFSSIGDVEFIDPAILAVGRGRLPNSLNNNSGLDMKSTFPSQLSATDDDARLQFLMQQSISARQNLRISDHIGDRFSPLNDVYGIPSRYFEQPQVSNPSPFAQLSHQQQSRSARVPNGYWDGWNGVQSVNDLGMAELLRNERLGFNKYFPGYGDVKIRMPSSGDLYNRAFGM